MVRYRESSFDAANITAQNPLIRFTYPYGIAPVGSDGYVGLNPVRAAARFALRGVKDISNQTDQSQCDKRHVCIFCFHSCIPKFWGMSCIRTAITHYRQKKGP
jgi:hypothetical protein